MELREIDLFSDFSDGELEKFKSIVRESDLGDGEVLFEAGDPGDALYLIREGAVRIFIRLDKDEEKSLALLEAGTHLGEMTLLDGTPRSASARAEGPTRILKVQRDDFLALFKEYPQVALRLFISFLKVMGDRLRHTNEELVALYDVGKIIGDAPPPGKMLKEILARLIASTNAEFGVVLTFNDISNMLEVAEAQGKGFDSVLGLKTGAGDGLAGLALKDRKTLRIEKLSESAEFSQAARFGYERENMLVVPLVRGEKPIGAIILGDRADGRAFDSANENLIQAVASQAAAAVEAALYQQDGAARELHDRTYFRF